MLFSILFMKENERNSEDFIIFGLYVIQYVNKKFQDELKRQLWGWNDGFFLEKKSICTLDRRILL
jgi:hypothetical protein